MRILSSKDAVRAFVKRKPHSTWSDPARPDQSKLYELFDPGHGADRAFKPTPGPIVRAKFKIKRDARIFASGSCFAREIEVALCASGANVLSWTPQLGLNAELFHRYTTHAILGDFRFALEDSYSPDNVVESEGKWVDFTGAGKAETREEALRWRRTVIDIHKTVRDADVLFITLGLVETWFDRKTGAYTNLPPYGLFMGDRFELRVTDYAENLRALRQLIALVRARANPDIKIVLTVSPVPMAHSFSGDDVLVANGYSKAVLRAIAQDVAEGDDLIDYFPSYEMVTLADPKIAWRPDYRHVHSEYVQQIIAAFGEAYFED